MKKTAAYYSKWEEIGLGLLLVPFIVTALWFIIIPVWVGLQLI